MMHVWWPWALPQGPGICSLPFFVIYADKRIRHDACVTLEERYEDLLERYGRTEAAREGIGVAYRQGKNIESALEAQLGWALHVRGMWRLIANFLQLTKYFKKIRVCMESLIGVLQQIQEIVWGPPTMPA